MFNIFESIKSLFSKPKKQQPKKTVNEVAFDWSEPYDIYYEKHPLHTYDYDTWK